MAEVYGGVMTEPTAFSGGMHRYSLTPRSGCSDQHDDLTAIGCMVWLALVEDGSYSLSALSLPLRQL